MSTSGRTIAKGHIVFGMVSIPVEVYTAQDPQDIELHNYHKDCGERLNKPHVCPTHGVVGNDKVIKGYEYQEGRKGQAGKWVELTKDELAHDETKEGRPMEIRRFATMEELDPIYYEKTYYVVPQEIGTMPFGLLREAMQAEKRVALGTFVLRAGKEHPILLRPYRGVLAMDILLRTDEVREPPVVEGGTVDPSLLKATRVLIDAMSGAANLDEFVDTRRERILEIVKAKVAGQPVPTEKAGAKVKAPADLMEALRASMKMAAEKPKKKVKA